MIKSKLILLLITLLVIPLSYAQEEEEEKCGLTNLAISNSWKNNFSNRFIISLCLACSYEIR